MVDRQVSIGLVCLTDIYPSGCDRPEHLTGQSSTNGDLP